LVAATAPLDLQAPVPAHHGHDDGDEQPSAGARMVVAATPPLALQALVPAHYGDEDGDEQPSAGAIHAASAVETRSRELKRDEHTSAALAHGRFLSPGAVHVKGLEPITESDDMFELDTITPPSQQARVHVRHGD
jgi:hypothetical protein